MGLIDSVIGAVTGNRGAKKDREFAENQSNASMAFQAKQSRTAHQREVADLELAGLNPLLSANAGASAGSGALSQANSTVGETAAGAELAAGLLKTEAETANINQATKKTAQETKILKPQGAAADAALSGYQKFKSAAKDWGSEAVDKVTDWQSTREQKRAEHKQKVKYRNKQIEDRRKNRPKTINHYKHNEINQRGVNR